MRRAKAGTNRLFSINYLLAFDPLTLSIALVGEEREAEQFELVVATDKTAPPRCRRSIRRTRMTPENGTHLRLH